MPRTPPIRSTSTSTCTMLPNRSLPPTHIRRRHAAFLLLQNRDHLLFAEPAALHSVRLLRVRLYLRSVTFQGSASAGIDLGLKAGDPSVLIGCKNGVLRHARSLSGHDRRYEKAQPSIDQLESAGCKVRSGRRQSTPSRSIETGRRTSASVSTDAPASA